MIAEKRLFSKIEGGKEKMRLTSWNRAHISRQKGLTLNKHTSLEGSEFHTHVYPPCVGVAVMTRSQSPSAPGPPKASLCFWFLTVECCLKNYKYRIR